MAPALSPTASTGRPGSLVELLSLLAWLVPAALAAYVVNSNNNADYLTHYRYAHDVVAALGAGEPVLWFAPLGGRLFPDLPISLVAYGLALGEPTAWGVLFALINLALVFACLVLLGRALDVARPAAWLAASLFMLLLLVVGTGSDFLLTNVLATSHHNSLTAPAILFMALPWLLAGEGRRPRRLAWLAGGAILLGWTLQSNKLFLVAAMVPYLGSLGALWWLGRVANETLAAAAVLAVAILAVAGVFDLGLAQAPFVVSAEGALLEKMSGLTAEKLANRGRRVGGMLIEHILALGLVALALAALALARCGGWAARAGWPVALVTATFVATAVLLPLAMIVTGRLWSRYLLHVPILALATAAFALGALLEGSAGRWRRWWAPLVALATLLPLPVFVIRTQALQGERGSIQDLVGALGELHARGSIGTEGLGPYWIAHNKVILASPFVIASILPRGAPKPIGANAYRYWRWQGDCLAGRSFTFIVVGKGEKRPYRMLPEQLRERFGVPAEVVSLPGKPHDIWIYPDAVQGVDAFYGLLEGRIDRQGKPRPARCP